MMNVLGQKTHCPFYIVDEELFRFLPTIVVGTLDKVALISMQAAMAGFVGAPYGVCSEEGHGFVLRPAGKVDQTGVWFLDVEEV